LLFGAVFTRFVIERVVINKEQSDVRSRKDLPLHRNDRKVCAGRPMESAFCLHIHALMPVFVNNPLSLAPKLIGTSTQCVLKERADISRPKFPNRSLFSKRVSFLREE
jgi:hypothetical protein